MKKFFIPISVVLVAILIVVFYPRKKTEIELRKEENNDLFKQELITSFKNYRESIYQLKQIELVASLEKRTIQKQLNPEVCIKMAYDLQAFIMRTRLARKSIEKSECQKINKIFIEIANISHVPKVAKPSYQKRLDKDLTYFTDELNKQGWRKEDLIEKKKEFDQKTAANTFKLKKNPRSRKTGKVPPSKCMKTIFMHDKEFHTACRKMLK